MSHDQLSIDSFDDVLARRLTSEAVALAARWLDRLRELLSTEASDVFPSNQLLDHIPELIRQIANYVRAPDSDEIAANAAVIDKARELGLLRHRQQASIHQLLREYEIFAEILETFVIEEIDRARTSPESCLRVLRRIGRAVRALLRTTVETFVSEYTDTLDRQRRTLETFIHAVGHELRTPIGTLVVAASLLGKEGIAAEAARREKIVENMSRSTEHLSALVQNLQRMAAEALALDLPNEQTIDVTGVAREAARQLRGMAEARGIDVRIAEDLPTVTVDPARVELVLMNLLSNAIKYSDPAKPVRFVEIATGAVSGSVWSLTVRDNGLGIPPEAQRTIFERFSRAHTDHDDALRVDGSGLGLAIVRECVEALGGTITCQSEEGVGSTFEVRVPRRPVPAPPGGPIESV